MNFKIVDPLIGVFSGALVACVAAQVVPANWNMFAGMLAGMVCGMVLKFPLAFLLMPWFGSFEVMIPLAIIAMTAGMLGGMAAGMTTVSSGWTALAGGMAGLIITAIVARSNRKLTRAE
jgi:predicted branched-subunit amino acid permease